MSQTFGIDDSNPLVQTQSVSVVANTTVTATAATDLVSLTLNTAGGALFCVFTAHASNSGGSAYVYFRILVDGVVKCGGSVQTPSLSSNLPQSIALSCMATGLAPGAHVVKVQWYVSGSTGQIRPVSAPANESACLTVFEVSV